MVLEAAMYRKAVSYISQADALNFLLNLHTWSWYARAVRVMLEFCSQVYNVDRCGRWA